MTIALSRPCPHCDAEIPTPKVGRAVYNMVSLGSWRLHVRACVRRSPADRAFFRTHRRWPTKKVSA